MSETMKWIKLKDRMPSQDIDGEKVLVCRLLNKGQESQNPSILPVDKIHLCNVDETWWMSLPEPPIESSPYDLDDAIAIEIVNAHLTPKP